MSANTKNWHIDGKINLSHILATIGLIVSLFVWGSTVETRIETLHLRIEQSAAGINRIENTMTRNRKEARDDMRVLNAKLDKLLAKLPR